ncbi:MAG: tetratricopeptide repeat protein [Gammaproteobacteria bacterium]|nr:tetratricopeptide repeat protein [Gammaproteobacteria bacterium]
MRKIRFAPLALRALLRHCMLLSLLLATSVHAEIIWVGVKDPNVKDALYESYQGRHFNAITRLQMAQKLGRVLDQEQVGVVLGGLYLAYGFHDHAAKIFETVLGSEQPKEVRDQAWYFLAKTRYQRGNYAGALQALDKVQDTLDFGLTQERNLLEATILMKQNNYLDALKVLKKVNERSDWGLYAKFNKGVAIYHLGREMEGVKILDEVGSMNSRDPEIKALKDKANLVLSYGFLDKEKPDTAKTYLERMQLTGPFSNKALLALGRAYSDKKMHKQSLLPWLKLVERHPSDPAVQDAMMAVPYAYGQLEAYKQSLEYYEKAMLSFQAEIENINLAADAVGGGKMLEGMIRIAQYEDEGGDERKLKVVLNTPEGRYLAPLLASYEFREALHNYAALRLSLGKLEGWSARLDTYKNLTNEEQQAFEQRIGRVQSKVILLVEKYRHYLQSMAYDELERRKERLVNYFNEARFSVAQIYDYASKRWGTGNE